MDSGSFFATGFDPTNALPVHYDLTLVVASYFIAVLAGFAFIRLLIHVAALPRGPARVVWQVSGAVIMGLGIWAMHFVGMLAYRLPVPISYDPALTALSAAPAILGSFVAIRFVGSKRLGTLYLIVGSAAFGGGVGAMHYAGMAAMNMNATVRYDPVLFTASLAVAIGLGLVALAITKWIVRRGDELQLSVSGLASMIIGIAVAGMHYTAMASTLCYAAPNADSDLRSIDPNILAAATAFAAIAILAAAGGALAYDRRLVREILQREEASHRARISDQRLIEAMETMADDFALFDEADRLIFCNSHFKNAFLVQSSETVAQTFSAIMERHLAFAFPADVDFDREERLEEVVRHHVDPENPLLWQRAPKQWALVRQRRTADGGMVFLATDITDVKRAELEAERANQAKTEFLHSMSHELRTPLNGVIGIAEMLLAVDTIRNDETRAKEYLEDIRLSGEHLLTLVSDMLDMAAIERGTQSAKFEVFDAVPTLSDIVRTMQRGHPAKDEITITYQPPPGEWMIRADRKAFHQVVINLVANAMTHGGGNVTVQIGSRDASDKQLKLVHIVVSDKGPGMNSDLLEVVGQPFPHAHTPQIRSESTGSGLGLAIVAKLMQLNEGKLEISSGANVGTRVSTQWKAA